MALLLNDDHWVSGNIADAASRLIRSLWSARYCNVSVMPSRPSEI
jgi:hypothetical protein